MAVKCARTQEDLLMFVHGQVSPMARVTTAAHLAICPACRRRKEELARATSVLASAFRGPGMPAWRPRLILSIGRDAIVIGGTILAVAAMVVSYLATREPSGTYTSASSPSRSPQLVGTAATKRVDCTIDPKK